MTIPKQRLLSCLADAEAARLVARYASIGTTSPNDVAERYRGFAARLQAARFVVTVAGVQGSGKSTLLNGLTFARPVLPIDADETTCVPTEIVFSASPSADATVHYRDGHSDQVAATEQSLGRVAHNVHNPGNIKGVTRIELESSEAFLAGGVVLVDLPGTGSLTKANAETTGLYLDEAVGAVFMLRTVPPLTRSDSVFVANVWARTGQVFFVQNRWTDESDEEAEAGREHNVRVLRDIGKRHRIPNSEELEARALLADYDAKVLGAEALNGEDCWLLELTAKREGVSYYKRKLWISKKTHVAMKMERYAETGLLLKTMTARDIKVHGGRNYPMVLEMQDAMRKGSKTTFTMSDAVFDVAIPESTFSRRNLMKGN